MTSVNPLASGVLPFFGEQPTVHESLAAIFDAIGNTTRMKVLQLLCDVSAPVPVKSVADTLNMKHSIASSHLIALSEVNFAIRKEEGSYVTYQANKPAISKVLEVFNSTFHI